MEIYLLREQKEVGPYAPDDVRSWLHSGHVSATELAWAPGLSEWQPLHSVLDPGVAWVEPEEQDVEEPAPVPRGPLATPRQKAFLSYLGVAFHPEVTEAEAEELTAQATKLRKNAARIASWEDDKLQLHPEMFVAEIQARTKDRPNFFHRMVIAEGGDCFTGVTKAHCQVLVGYLDVNHPHWDAKPSEATWKYFFPAIAEKFPQLVKKEWRAKLKFPAGPRVSAELLGAPRVQRGRPGSGRVRSLVSALVVVLAIAVVAGAAVAFFRPELLPTKARAQVASLRQQVTAAVRGDEAPARKETAPRTGAKKEAAGAAKPVATPGSSDPAPAEGSAPAPTLASAAPKPEKAASPDGMAPGDGMAPAMGEPKAPAATMAPAEQPKPTEALFNPNATPSTPAPGMTAAPVVSPTDTVPKTMVTVTQPIQLQLAYGKVTISSGTSLKLVAREGDTVKLNYMNLIIAVPVSSTDLAGTR